jgi:hypothetical protein
MKPTYEDMEKALYRACSLIHENMNCPFQDIINWDCGAPFEQKSKKCPSMPDNKECWKRYFLGQKYEVKNDPT